MNGPSRTFERRLRLVKPGEYKRIFDQASRRTKGCLTVLAVENGLDIPRLGMVISTRTARNAVTRNRLKRLIRESFRLNQEKLNGLDIVIIGRPGVELQTNQELLLTLSGHWSKLERCVKR